MQRTRISPRSMIMLSVIATVMITVPLAYQYSDAVDAAQGYVTSGSVSITEVAELTVNSTSGNYASLVKFNSTFYAMFYSDDGADGQVVHVTTNENMDQGASSIPDAFATTGEFFSADNQFNATDATHIDAVYNNATSALVAYQGTDADGFAAVVQITDNTVTTGNLLEFDVADASHIAIHRLNSTNAFIAYQGVAGDGFVVNYEYANEASTAQSLEIDGTDFAYPAWAGYNHSIGILAFQGAAGDGFVAAVQYDPGGTGGTGDKDAITAASNTLEFDTGDASHIDIISVFNSSQAESEDSIFAITYQGADGDGFLKTISVSQDPGSMVVAEIDSAEFDTADASFTSIAQVSQEVFAIAYAGVDTDTDFDGDGFIKTYVIDVNGAISPNYIQDLEFETSGINGTVAINHDANSIAVGYIGSDLKPYVSTFTINKHLYEYQAWEHQCTIHLEGTEGVHTGNFECVKPKLSHSNDRIASIAPTLSDEMLVSLGLDQHIINTSEVTEVSTLVANPGEPVKITLNLSDDGGIEDIQNVALYTNFGEQPSNMNYYYANNFNEAGEVSNTLYQWNKHTDDLIYDSTKSVAWEEPTITSNEDGTMSITFAATFNEIMAESELVTQVIDSDYGLTQVTLPFKIKVGDYHETYEEIFGINPDYRIATSVAEPLVISEIHKWNMDTYGEIRTEYDTNGSDLLNILGLKGQALPEWTKNLSQWVLNDQIDLAELIIALEYLSNTTLVQ